MKNKLKMRENIRLFYKGMKLLISCSATFSMAILVLSTISALVSPFNAILYKKFLDSIMEMIEVGAWLDSEFQLLFIMLLTSLIGYSINSLLQFTKQIFSDKLDLFVSESVLQQSIKFPMETFDNAEIYNHITISLKRTSASCMNLLDALSECFNTIVKAGSFLYIISTLSWKIVPASVFSVIPVLYLSLRINSYWYKIFFGRAEKNRLIEYLKLLMVKNENIKEIKLYGVGNKIASFIKKNQIDFLTEDIKARKVFLRKGFGAHCVDEIASWTIKIWLLALSIGNKCSLGTIMLYINSLDSFKHSINGLFSQISSLHKSLLYLYSVDIIEKEKCADDGIEKLSDEFTEIEFRNVSFRYPCTSSYAVKNISLKLERGKTYFIVGFNGSGKTTLLKLLLRLYKPTEGQILIDGINIQDINLDSYYSKISAIFQDFIKYPFTISENIDIRTKSKNKQRLFDVLEKVGMNKFVEHLPQKEKTLLMKDWNGGIDMSQGQWQKIAIARCIFDDSAISIFDEPFSSIDAEAETYIIDNLRKNCEEKFNIFITHRFSSISLTDQIIVMKEGAIIEKGTHETLIQNRGMYFDLYTSQIPK